jgi:alkylation response protein AidB-like acyl-CoA dehydrogenase
MELTAEQQAFAAAIGEFCNAECATLSQRDALTEGGALADSPLLLKKLADLGWLGVSLPAEYGGGGGAFVDECVFLEATARGLAPIHAYASGLTAAQTYLKWGSNSQRRTVVSNLASGRFEAIALSEPRAGSDLGGVRLRFERDGDSYIVNGQKTGSRPLTSPNTSWCSAARTSRPANTTD